jgi:NADH:ubiquinone oxidoreductase subunit 6 (subunit J)
MGVFIVLLVMLAACATMAVYASRLVISALWLAGVSVITALLLYEAGATVAAVLELSIGAGLVTVLLMLAISVAGDKLAPSRRVVPRRLAIGMAAAAALAAVTLVFPIPVYDPDVVEPAFGVILWEQRAADVLLQVALIFTGLLTVLGLLAETRAAAAEAQAASPIAQMHASLPSIRDLPEAWLDAGHDIEPVPLPEEALEPEPEPVLEAEPQ